MKYNRGMKLIIIFLCFSITAQAQQEGFEKTRSEALTRLIVQIGNFKRSPAKAKDQDKNQTVPFVFDLSEDRERHLSAIGQLSEKNILPLCEGERCYYDLTSSQWADAKDVLMAARSPDGVAERVGKDLLPQREAVQGCRFHKTLSSDQNQCEQARKDFVSAHLSTLDGATKTKPDQQCVVFTGADGKQPQAVVFASGKFQEKLSAKQARTFTRDCSKVTEDAGDLDCKCGRYLKSDFPMATSKPVAALDN